ncbi:MAG: phytanoyl-CoA dioxygenase family protein [Labilithrix sp.]|nr:phytanoyl-CoA dioxygenase family protein [Labilithrix sp.]
MIARLRDAGLPAVFVLATDSALALGELVQQAVSVCLSEAYTLVADVWAWEIPRGRSGWSAHRGISTLLDRARPELVNTWIALSDVPVERSCMHFVPLDADAGYPDDLAAIAASPPSGGHATALTTGEALAWNANVLHWGGPCAVDCAGPRVSCAFSLVRTDALPAIGLAPLTASATPTERVDLVATQIATYGAGQHDVSDEILEWARATFTLSALSRGSGQHP